MNGSRGVACNDQPYARSLSDTVCSEEVLEGIARFLESASYSAGLVCRRSMIVSHFASCLGIYEV